MSYKVKSGRWLRTVAVILASVTVLGALGSLIAFRPERPDSGEIKSDNATVTPGYGYRAQDYASLYAQDGLRACYLAYSGCRDSITISDVDEALWHNQVPGGDPAVFVGGNRYWQPMRGGFGYNMTEAEWNADRNNVGLTIPYDLSETATQDYGVECVISYLGVTAPDGTPFVSSAKNGLYSTEKSAFRFDLLCATSFVAQHETKTDVSLANRWMLTNQAYKDHYYVEGEQMLKVAKENMPYQRLNQVVLMYQFRDWLEGAYMLDHKVYYESKNKQIYRASKVVYGQDLDALRACAYTDAAPRFSLFNGFPGVLYAVRYYDRSLSDRELTQNYFVDLLGFYGVKVSPLLQLDAAARAELLRTCGEIATERGVSFTFDNAEQQKALLLQIIDEEWKGVL